MSLRLRRGGIVGGGPPPPPQNYGPSIGIQPVKDGVGPRAVPDPGSGVTFTNASNIQTLIDSNGSNTIFRTTTPGTYNNFRNIIYSQKRPRFFFVGNASSYSINGGSTDNIGLNGTGSGANGGLEVRGGTWTAYGLPTGTNTSVPAILIGGGGGISVIQDAAFNANNQTGLQIYINLAASSTMATMLISHCSFTNGGRYGLAGSSIGTSALAYYTPTMEYNLLDNNNTRQLGIGDDSGGMKFGFTDGMICRLNWGKNNYSYCFWWDGPNRNILCYDNVSETNLFGGYDLEIVNGGNVVRNNYSKGDGLGDPTKTNVTGARNDPFNNIALAVYCAASDGTGVGGGPNVTSEIHHNWVDCTAVPDANPLLNLYAHPIGLCDHTGHAASNQVRNWSVHHNLVYQRSAVNLGRTGLFDAHNENQITLSGAQNHFDFNEYHVLTPGGNYYEHDGVFNFTQWQARPQDQNGTEAGL